MYFRDYDDEKLLRNFRKYLTLEKIHLRYEQISNKQMK